MASSIVGTSILYRFGGRGTITLGAFFASGSVLSRLGKRTADIQIAGSHRRDERQVIANGGVAAMAGPISQFLGAERSVVMLVGSLAAATSDTWATEIGLRSGQLPRYVVSGRPVEPGLSGGITPAGTLASVAGAGAIALIAAITYRSCRLGVVAMIAGVSGSIVDSILGELVQSKRRLPGSGRLYEDAEPDTASVHASGWTWVDNDVVNLACTLAGGLVGVALWEAVATDGCAATCGVDLPANSPPSS